MSENERKFLRQGDGDVRLLTIRWASYWNEEPDCQRRAAFGRHDRTMRLEC